MNRRNTSTRLWVALALFSGACSSNSGPNADDESSTSSSTDDAPSSTTDTTDTAMGSSDDTGVAGGECDPLKQDCGEGEKCTAVAKTEGTPWDYNKCVPAPGEGLAGDLCDVQDNKYSGLDNCAEGLLCMLTDPDGKGGVCIEFCSPESTCTMSDATCEVYNDGVLPICLPPCDPLNQDCPEGQACYQGAAAFVCFKEVAKSGQGGQGEPCMSVNICQKGFTCSDAATVPGCTGMGCCTAFCAVSEGDAPCGPDLMCVPFFADGEAPQGYENVGLCSIPQ